MKAGRLVGALALLVVCDVSVLLGSRLEGTASSLAYLPAAVAGSALAAGFARRRPGPGQVVVDEEDLLELSRAVRGLRQGLKDGARYTSAAPHAFGRIRHGLVVIAWKLAGEPFPNQRTDWEILEDAFGEDLPGYRLPWPHALDEFHCKELPRAPKKARDPHGIRTCPRCSGEIASGSFTCEGCGMEVDS